MTCTCINHIFLFVVEVPQHINHSLSCDIFLTATANSLIPKLRLVWNPTAFSSVCF